MEGFLLLIYFQNISTCRILNISHLYKKKSQQLAIDLKFSLTSKELLWASISVRKNNAKNQSTDNA